ncbi:MAG: zinc ribbon domain-containing protein [Dehalococcoidia bacterium]
MDWPGGSWQDTLRIVATGAGAYLALVWLGMVVWTYRDIRDRTRDIFYEVFSLMLVLFFNLAGLLVYLLVRPRETLAEVYQRGLEEEAILQDLGDVSACPTCRRAIEPDFIICPSCQTQLKEPCDSCGRPLSYSWVACPYCTTSRQVAMATASSTADGERPSAQPQQPERPRRRPRAPREAKPEEQSAMETSTGAQAETPY